MKNTSVVAISASIGILVLLLAMNSNIYQTSGYKDEEYDEHDEKDAKATLWVFIHFDQEPTYYGKAVISIHDVSKKFDFDEEASEYGSPFKMPYYYYYEKPYEDELCLKNVDSGDKNCVDVYKKDKDIDIHMPD